MKKVFCIALTLVMLSGLQACNDTRKSKNYNDKTLVDDTGIALIKNGVESSNAEVRLSNLALKNSQNSSVTNFAKMMVTDHTNLAGELKKLAESKKVNTSDSLTVEHEQLLVSLAKKTGAEFDKEYIQAMVNDHEKAVQLFKNAANNTDKAVNDMAGKNLPKLEEHLNAANSLCKDLK